MPFYRINGCVVHMRGTNLPQPCCAVVGVGDKRHQCAAMSGYLCDWPLGSGRTCDRALCSAHVHQVGNNRHYCAPHLLEQENQRSQRSLFTGLVQQ